MVVAKRGDGVSGFYERPILNSPYRVPELHHLLDQNGQPVEGEPRQGRRPSRFIVPRSGLTEEVVRTAGLP